MSLQLDERTEVIIRAVQNMNKKSYYLTSFPFTTCFFPFEKQRKVEDRGWGPGNIKRVESA